MIKTWHRLEAQAKSSKYRNQFSLTPLQLIVHIWIWWINSNALTISINKKLYWLYWSKFRLILLFLTAILCFKLSNFRHYKPVWYFRKGLKQKSNMRAAIRAVIKPNPPQEVVQTIIRYNLYWFASSVNIVIRYKALLSFWKVRFL